ncbi:hypothetical protein D0T49_03515 [Paludibacter sp. 221]|uniref:hypothetical protein n=1 Tax=Paludibacter sp. 221 TaxID=2302939 RepID=UPI0013D0D858|nr:hypothetical protein [Paludibacter sp. 221]NDV46109.1 hypothetical protein [Paludibacter sp. 221]
MKKSIDIQGISTTSLYNEGDCAEAVNVRKKNGALHPVTPRKVIKELDRKYDIIVVHSNSDYENWIGVILEAEKSTIYYNINNVAIQIGSVSGKINSIQQIGNTLSFVTEDDIYYALYTENDYKLIGVLPELPVIQFGSDDAHLYTKTDTSSWTGGVNPDSEEIELHVKSLVYGIINKIKEENESVLFDGHLIRYAFRLHDNSLIKHSPPILLLPGIEKVKHESKYKELEHEFGGILAAKYATLKAESGGSSGVYRNNLSATITAYSVLLNYDLSTLNDFKDIIKSVDVFLSPALNLSNIENIRKDIQSGQEQPNEVYHEYFWTPFPLIAEGYKIVKHIHPVIEAAGKFVKTQIPLEAINTVKEESLFYHIRSLEIGSEGVDVKFPDVAKDLIPNLDNLVYQEQMSTDSFSHHNIGAGNALIYNSRLHLSDIKTTFFKGFSPDYFQWNGNRYNDVSAAEELLTVPRYIVVELNVDNVKKYAISEYKANDKEGAFFSAYFSYPDSRATRFYVITRQIPNILRCIFSEELTAHNSLNISYFLRANYKTRSTNTPQIGTIHPITDLASMFKIPSDLDWDKIPTYKEQNKIRVSELNNPFYFPAINTYMASNGEILNMAANVMNVSDRNFGMYPLYIATTQGFFMLSVGSGEVVYSNVTPSSSREVPVLGLLCPTPYGIAFVGQRGIYIINGNETTCITLPVEQFPESMVLDGDKKQLVSFREYIKTLSALIYNPTENELIIVNKDYGFNYVYCFDTRNIYQSTERIDYEVGNTYPKLLVAEGNKIKDYFQSGTNVSHIEFTLRPLYFGIDEVKKLQRAIVRGLFYQVRSNLPANKAFLALYGSNDGVNHTLLRGFGMPANVQGQDYKDFDLGLMTRSTYRNYFLSLIADVDEETEIRHIDFEIADSYTNDKMR